MLLEVHGGGFGNKGAQLMLLTVLNRFRGTGAQFFMSPAAHLSSDALAEYGLLRHFPYPVARGGRLFPPRFAANLALASAVPRSVCDRLGVVRYQDSDGLLDISGIRFGDASSDTAGTNFIRLARYYRRRSKPVILLPQMLGPFQKPRSAELFRRLLVEATLVFARDRQSYDHARGLVGADPKLKLAPDITVFCEVPQSQGREDAYGCIVPNARMLDRGQAAWGSTYADLLVAAAQTMIEAGLRPIVLVHSVEGSEDNPLAAQVVRRVGPERCEMRIADDPLETKAFIGNAKLIVASRYHSIVSALSSGVPAIVMGWAHKYDTLLQEFGVPELQQSPGDGREQLCKLVANVASDSENQRLRGIIRKSREALMAPHEEMWRLVASALSLPEDALLQHRQAA